MSNQPTMSVATLWRYPVKSMMGEELNGAQINQNGLLGDRSYALIDTETNKVVSAKNAKKWPNFFAFEPFSPRHWQPMPSKQYGLPCPMDKF